MGMLSVVKKVPQIIRRGGGKILFKLDKNKPQILVGAGAVIMIGGFVWAIVNARKIDNVIAEGTEKVEAIQQKMNDISAEGAKTKELSVLSNDLRKAKAENIVKMGMLMGPPCLAFMGGMGMALSGHILLLGRFGEVSMALSTLQASFDKYRAMNIAEHGEECDRRYRYGVVGETEVETTVTDENGNEQKVMSKVPIVDELAASSMYSFIFSPETSPKCPKDPVNTISFLRSQQTYWNTWMSATGKPVTLIMILNDLGIKVDYDDPANDYILIAGWRPNGDGDNLIDFGVMRAINKPTLDLIENSVMLNFNCDGNLYHSARYKKDGRKVC